MIVLRASLMIIRPMGSSLGPLLSGAFLGSACIARLDSAAASESQVTGALPGPNKSSDSSPGVPHSVYHCLASRRVFAEPVPTADHVKGPN